MNPVAMIHVLTVKPRANLIVQINFTSQFLVQEQTNTQKLIYACLRFQY